MSGRQVLALLGPLLAAIRWPAGVVSWGLVAALLAVKDEALDDPGSALILVRAAGVIAVLGAGFVLDDEAAGTLESSPSTLAWRRSLRVLLAVLLVAVPWMLILWRLDAHGTRLPVGGLTLEVVALLAVALATAAAVSRRSGTIDPGVATTPAVFVLVLGAFQLPPMLALYAGSGSGWDEAHIRWAAVLAAGALALLWLSRDPAARGVMPWPRPGRG